ncbi:S9 family peptidase, partial [bacterium]
AGKENPARLDLYKVDINSGSTVRMTKEDGMYRNPQVSPDGTKALASFSNWEKPSELLLVDNGKEKALTESHRPGAFAKVNALKPQLFSYKNRKGMDVRGYVFVPEDMKKGEKRPLFLYVYGGPLGTGKSVEEGSFNSTSYLFAEYLTRVFGYVTATIDPRGQSGYGNAFGKANYEAPGVAQVEDLTDGVKYLQATYGTDPAKTGINGWSFGGFQTQMCMYTAPDVFTLGIAGAGPTEWQNYNTWYSTGVIGPVPTGKPEDLDKYSLTHLAKNLRGPLMLLHGVEDTNVLFQDTIKVYRKLLQYGKGPLVELSIDPTGGHGMGGDMDTRDRHAIYLSFINRWWGPYTKP